MRGSHKIGGNRSGNKIIFIFAVSITLSISYSFSQTQQSKPTRQSALDAFSKGRYEVAYKEFNELLITYPRDPLYKYYCGVSLVKLEKEPAKALSLLKEAQQGSVAIRLIPSDAFYYIGRAFQMNGNFTEAINSYNSYTEEAGKKTAKENFVPQLIQQCNEKKGGVVPLNTNDTEIVKKVIVPTEIIEKEPMIQRSENPKADTIIREEKSPPPEYLILINEALNFQFRADSLMNLVALYRKQSDSISISGKPEFKMKISDAEQLAGIAQKLANEKLLSAESCLRPGIVQNVIQDKSNQPDSTQVMIETLPLNVPKDPGIRKDTLKENKEETFSMVISQKVNNETFKDNVNQPVTKNNNLVAQSLPSEIYSIFEVVAKPVFALNEKVRVNPEVPAGLIYHIQVAVFKNAVVPSYFKGITPVYGFKSEGSELTNYYAGMFRKSADASKALAKVKSTGFKDAFVVALMDKKIVSAERAGILEKEWGNKTLSGIDVQKTLNQPRDTIPPTLTFRVEVAKSQKPLTSEQLEAIKRLAGNRGLDIFLNPAGQSIYLIGKFLTFESAAEYADLLTRNGQKEVRVTAYLGRREIPVETAKQLFEKF